MKNYRLHRFLLVVALLFGVLALVLLGQWSPTVDVARAAQSAATVTATPAIGVSSPQPTLTWTTPANTNPTGVAGETVTVDGSGFDVAAGPVVAQLETASSANAGCPPAATSSASASETTSTFRASFTLDTTAKAGARFIVCAFPSGAGTVVHSKTLTLVTPVLCADSACGIGAADSVAVGARSVMVTGKDWEPIGAVVTITLCCNAAASPTTPTVAPTKASQSQPTRTPIVVPTITITPPSGLGLDRELSSQRPVVTSAPITTTVTVAPCADNAAAGCFTATLPLPANAKIGDTFTLTAQAQGNVEVTRGPAVNIVAVATSASTGGVLGALGDAIPELFLVIVLLLLLMVSLLIWLATRREAGVGRQG